MSTKLTQFIWVFLLSILFELEQVPQTIDARVRRYLYSLFSCIGFGLDFIWFS